MEFISTTKFIWKSDIRVPPLAETEPSKKKPKKSSKHNAERAKSRVYYRLFMEEMLGRPLRPDEDVHHINGNWKDDRPENLEVIPHKEHFALHIKFQATQRNKI